MAEGTTGEYTKHRGSSITSASEEAIKSYENKWAIPEEENETDEVSNKETVEGVNEKKHTQNSVDGTVKSDEEQRLPGSTTRT